MRFTLVNLCQKIGDLTLKESNLPERYIRRVMNPIVYQTPNLPNYAKKVVRLKSKVYFDVHRPWTPQFLDQNRIDKNHRKVFIEPIKEWKIFKGDRVQVLVGKDKGKQGIVVQVIQERNWVIVEGLNTYLKLIGKTKGFRGMLVQHEAPLLVTNEVSLVDPTDLLPVEVEWRYTEDGKKVRVSKRSQRIIPVPVNAQETYDFKLPSLYLERPRDTAAKEVEKVTFVPTLETFEMCIMREMGIQEDREEAPSFWY